MSVCARWNRVWSLWPLLMVFAVAGCTTTAGGGVNFLAQAPEAPKAEAAQSDENAQILEGLNALEGEMAASPKLTANHRSVNRILQTAFSQVGTPYRYGGNKPETGFDCSGFVGWVYGQYNVRLPRSSGDMMAKGTTVPRKELRPGDLVFFGRKKRITHVGIYTGDNKYIHSPSTGKRIQESSLDDRGRGEYYVGARRVINNEGVTSIDEALKRTWVAQARRQFAGKPAGDRTPAPAPAPALAGVTTAPPLTAAPSVEALSMMASLDLPPEILNASASEPQTILPVLAEGQVAVQTEVIVIEQTAAPETSVASTAPAGPGASAAAKADAKAETKAETKTAAKADAKAGTKTAAKAETKAGTKTAAKSDAKISQAERDARKHKVASGDTLFALARKYGVTIDDLAKANNIDKNKSNLKLGQMLVVPSKTRTN